MHLVASDCANVIRRISDGDRLGSYGQIVQEIVATVRGFQAFEFAHEGRRSNGDAHGLARGSLFSNLGRHVWPLSLMVLL